MESPAEGFIKAILVETGETIPVNVPVLVLGDENETVEQAYVREARAVRESVGIVDVSTLGKIDVQGAEG